MQTFLPYDDFRASAEVLDMKRLGKQRVETMQILSQLTGIKVNNATMEPIELQSRGWGNHPMTRMWRGYENALAVYGCVVSKVWQERGYNDTCYEKILIIRPEAFDSPLVTPPWFGWLDFHVAHRSNLIRKDPDWYGPLFGNVPNDLEYLWPV